MDFREKTAEQYTALVSNAFGLIGTVNMGMLALPFVTYRKKPTGTKTEYPLKEAIGDYLANDKPWAAFIEVLEKSKCPHVAALKQAYIDQYLASNLDELVEFDVGGEA